MTIQTLARSIAEVLRGVDDARSRALSSALMMTTGKAKEVVAAETKRAREALDKIAELHSDADELLDQLETSAGLVDPETGARIDE